MCICPENVLCQAVIFDSVMEIFSGTIDNRGRYAKKS